MFYGRRKLKAPARPKSEIEAEKAAKLALSKTCQICARSIFAETGTIAHHGYERPYEGYQTSSCPGAKKLPFEVSCDELRAHVASQQEHLDHLMEFRDKLARDEMPAVFTEQRRTGQYVGRKPVYKTVTVHATPDNYDELKAEHRAMFMTYGLHSYQNIKDRDLRNRNDRIKSISDYLTFQQGRLNAWKGPTFKRQDGEWVPVPDFTQPITEADLAPIPAEDRVILDLPRRRK